MTQPTQPLQKASPQSVRQQEVENNQIVVARGRKMKSVRDRPGTIDSEAFPLKAPQNDLRQLLFVFYN